MSAERIDPEDAELTRRDYASRGKRLGGALLDALFSMVLIVPLMFALGAFEGLFDKPKSGQLAFELDLGLTATLFAAGMAHFLLLHSYLLYKYGQTLGKRIVGTRIVDEQGNVPNFGKLFVMRYFLIGLISNVPFLGGMFGLVNVLLIFRPNHRCLHDDFAGTYVVNA